MRAKFQVERVDTQFNDETNPRKVGEKVFLRAVYGGTTNAEDNQFSVATPSGTLEMHISNPNAFDFLTKETSFILTSQKQIINMGAIQQDTSANFMQVQPDSHSWQNINQIIRYIEATKDTVDKDELVRLLIVGLNNTKERGYNLSLETPVAIKIDKIPKP